MKRKLLILIIAALVGGSVIVIVVRQSSAPTPATPKAKPGSIESELPTAMSNYQKTFKLDTSAPNFPQGKSATNTNQTKP